MDDTNSHNISAHNTGDMAANDMTTNDVHTNDVATNGFATNGFATNDLAANDIRTADIAAVRRLLHSTADEAGGWSEPPSVRAMLARRRGRRRAVLGAAVAVVAIIGVAVPVALTSSHRRSATSSLVGPSVTASVSTVLPGGTWKSLPRAPIVARSPAVTAWTGTQMLVWGGANGNTEYADGAAYDPTSRVWTKLPPSPLSARSYAASVWTGKYLFIFGNGDGDVGRTSDAAMYDPAAHAWTAVTEPPVTAFTSVDAYWTGRQVLLLAVPGRNVDHLVLQAFDPTTQKWTRLPDLMLKPDHDGQSAGAVVAGSTFYVWSEWAHTVQDSSNGTETTPGVDAYAFDLTTQHWTSVQSDPPVELWVRRALWTGREILIPPSAPWCGFCAGPLNFNETGVRVDPRRRSVQTIPHGPIDDEIGQQFWTGSVLLLGNTSAGVTAYWAPTTNRWTTLPRAPLAGNDPAIVWTGRSLLIWGQLSPSAHPSAKPSDGGIELSR